MAAAVKAPSEGPPSNRAEAKTFNAAEDHIDIEALLSRPRPLGRRRNRPLYRAPEFVKRLSAFEEVEVGKDVVFACQWKAFPKPDFRWFRDEAEVTHDPRYQIREGDNGVLTLYIRKVTKHDEGAYKCCAENPEGTNSTTGYLSVKGDIKEKVLSAQPRMHAEHAVSYPPCLRTIVEQHSLEEVDAAEYVPVHLPLWAAVAAARSCPEAGEQIPDYRDDEDSGSDTSVESQVQDDDVAAPLADTEDYDSASTPSTAEPELFHMDDVDDLSGETSRESSVPYEPRLPLPVSEPPRFNTPRLRTPTPPLLPSFRDDPPRTVVESGPTYTRARSRSSSSSSSVESDASFHDAPLTMTANPKLSRENHVDTEPRVNNPHTASKTSRLVYNRPPKILAVESRVAVVRPGARVETIPPAHVLSQVDVPGVKSNGELPSHPCPHTPFPWATYTMFSIWCGFCGSLVHMHPMWFILLVAVLSLVSFRFTVVHSPD